MTEIGEKVGVSAPESSRVEPKYLLAAVTGVTFDSGIRLYVVEAGGGETEVPPAGTPHWGSGRTYPAAYVREGGAGDARSLKVKVRWSQRGCDGRATLTGRSSDGALVVEGGFDVSGDRGDAEVSCQFTKRPKAVANFGRGVPFTWTVECGGRSATASGGGPLALYFLDAKPKPIAWAWYKAHYLKVVDWATSWAEGKQGRAEVLPAIWDKFSNGSSARVPHVTGFSYWKTGDPVQDLKTLLQPDGGVGSKGWSCRAIAHLFMECLALHGIACREVVPVTAPGTEMFLVHNWDVAPKPLPNWETDPDLYYAGSWVYTGRPPLNARVPTSLTRRTKAGPIATPLGIDMRKTPGVPAQGQPKAPLGFGNHWIVQVDGALYDTSYGVRHPNDLVAYARTSLAGWLVARLADTYREDPGDPTSPAKASSAWVTRDVARHALVRNDGASN